VDGVKLTSGDTIATSQTTKAAGSLSGTAGIHGRTGAQTGILGYLGTISAGTVTSDNGNFGLAISNSHTKKVGHLAHHVGTTNRTVQSVDAPVVGTFYQGVGHSATTGETTSAAVGTRQHLVDLRNAGIFEDSKLLGTDEQHDGCDESDASKYNDCNQDKIHNSYLFYFVLLVCLL
jgi:hypothetical protein